MSDTIDFIGAIHPWLARYDAMTARHAANLAPFRDEDGNVLDDEYPRHDERRSDNTIEADGFLDSLAARLRELAGPPVPGETFTLAFAGTERHDGGDPSVFVVNGADLDDARSALLDLASFQTWLREQTPWGTKEEGNGFDVLFVADQSHPGIPGHGTYDDLRREQAAHLAATASAEPPLHAALPNPATPAFRS